MYVFLDTNVYLQCVPLKDIDFCGFLDAETVTILVPRVMIKELDKHKGSRDSSRLRNQAIKAASFLETMLKSNEPLRAGVSIELVRGAPKVDFEALDLDREKNDDILIALALDRKNTEPDIETVVVSLDTNVRLICSSLGVRAIDLDDKYRLPLEPDPLEQENQRLRRENQKLQNARPKLKIGFGSALESMIRFELREPGVFDEHLAKVKIAHLKESLLEAVLPPRTGRMRLGAKEFEFTKPEWVLPDRASIERYNTELATYFDDYEHHLRDVFEKQEVINRSFQFSICIKNVGSAPAEDIDVSLHFPDGFSLFTADEFPRRPKEPKPPKIVRSQFEAFVAGASLLGDRHSAVERAITQLHESRHRKILPSLSIRKTNSYIVHDHSRGLKHGLDWHVADLALTFDSHEEVRSFHCEYQIHVGNIVEPDVGELNFVSETP